ncbi:MAG: DsbC family protein [Burkholderiaceae bacterium]|nr:DsbC family protein [Burkholderiaceae bacterium]
MKNWILAALLAAFSALALAQTPPPAARGSADESAVRTRVEQRFNAKPDSATRMPFGLWEIVIGTEVFYVDQEVDELLRVDFKSLPLDQAFKIVRGDGSRKLVTFEDPNCGYCKKLYRDIAGLKNVTIYTFLYPILSQDSFEKSKAIWCAKDRAKAWDDWMLNGKAPASAAADCKNPLQQNMELGRKLEVTGTPTIVFADGRRMPGAVPLEKIEATFKELGGK